MFVTIDFEIADRTLPSICDIAIITWDGWIPIDEFASHVNPGCNVEPFFNGRHGLTDDILKQAPFLNQLWIPIFDRLEHKTVFCFNPNQVFRTMMQAAEMEFLNMPDFIYGSVQSICKRTWGYSDENLHEIAEKLNITKTHNNALEDARTIGKILYKASVINGAKDPQELFRTIGFAGGNVKNGIRTPYKVQKVKNKENNRFFVIK